MDAYFFENEQKKSNDTSGWGVSQPRSQGSLLPALRFSLAP